MSIIQNFLDLFKSNKKTINNEELNDVNLINNKIEEVREKEETKDKEIVKIDFKLPNMELLGDESTNIVPFVEEMKKNEDILIPLGVTENDILLERINTMPNLLVGGTVMSGKTTFVNSILTSLLLTRKPDEVKLVIYDSKMVDYAMYNGIPHMLLPIINDPKKISATLQRVVVEMNDRICALKEKEVKNVKEYNKKVADEEKMPAIIVIIDDISTTPFEEVTDSIERLSANGWKTDIFLIVVSNHPTAKIMSTISKSNFPARICFKVASVKDSQIIIDKPGAEIIIGYGTGLYVSRFHDKPLKVTIPYVTDDDIRKIIESVKSQQTAVYDEKYIYSETKYVNSIGTDDDPLYSEILEFAIESGKISASLIQRRFGLGYNRCARIIDIMEEKGVIGPQNGSKPREVLIGKDIDEEDY